MRELSRISNPHKTARHKLHIHGLFCFHVTQKNKKQKHIFHHKNNHLCINCYYEATEIYEDKNAPLSIIIRARFTDI